MKRQHDVEDCGMVIASRRGPRQQFAQSRGFSLIETIAMLALTAAVIPAIISAVSTVSRTSDNAYDRSILFELAQSQLEDVQRQAFQTSPASYSLLSAPAGYSISVATVSAVTYTYPAPSSSNTVETVSQVTVTVTGVRANLTLVGYKVR